MGKLRQRIRYLRTEDDVQLAWSEIGAGPTLIKASNWLSHLEYELESPVWGHWIRFFGDHFRFLRWDERGCGLTDRDVHELSFDHWLRDLEAVVAASEVDTPFALLGISSGAATCVAFAARHPERVSRMILYGGYARGWAHRDDSEREREHRAMLELMRIGWGKENPVFRQVFTSRFIPGGSGAQIGWFNELCRRTSSGEMAARLLEARSSVDVTRLLGAVKAPTLVVHSRDDEVCPISEARRLAAGIPAAQFVELDSRNHILLEDEPVLGALSGGRPRFHGPRGPARRGSRLRPPHRPRARGPRVDQPGARQRRYRRDPGDQREDRPQPHLESFRQARGSDPSAGDRLRARSRFPVLAGC